MSEAWDARDVEQLRRAVAGRRAKFVFFWGHKGPTGGVGRHVFSQWFASPFAVEGVRYPTAEHFMMAEKARLFGDGLRRERILKSRPPGAAKQIGREVRGFDEAVWAAHRFDIAVRGNLAKFGQAPLLGDYLAGTGKRVLAEASPVDRIWGIGLAADDPEAENPNRWRGLNLLGFALMEARRLLAGDPGAR